MFGFGIAEVGVIILIILIIFGPSLVRRTGRVIQEFRNLRPADREDGPHAQL